MACAGVNARPVAGAHKKHCGTNTRSACLPLLSHAAAQHSASPQQLRGRDFGDLPSDMCPRSAHKPKNLFSQLNAVVKKAASFKENVAKARNNISGLESGESVLAFVKRTKTAKGKAKKVAVEKEDGNQQKEKKTEKKANGSKQNSVIISSNPFDLLSV